MAKKITKTLKTVPISTLKEHKNNPNRHNDTQITALAKSIERYGQYYPIVVDEDMNILCGHGKKAALEQLGRKDAEVCVINGLTEKEKLKLLVEDNKIQSLGFIEYEKVEEIIKEIGETDILGFPADYVDAILGEMNTDAMGVDLTAPISPADMNNPQPKNTPENQTGGSKESTQTEKKPSLIEQFEQASTSARIILCPHCGKEIAL